MSEVTTLIAGSHQHSYRDEAADHPARTMAGAALAALADAGIDDLRDVDLLAAVEPLSWTYADLNQAVADAMALPGGEEHLWVPAGGTSPQDLLHLIGNRIAQGEIDCAVICGAESMRTRRRAARQGVELPWPQRPADVDPMRGQAPFTSELEARHGLRAPIHTFPLFENALRSVHGRSNDEQRQIAATILAANAAVAADNPHAWFRDAPTATEIAQISEDNRMIVFPYTKRMNAIMEVDQCAAIVVVSASYAQRQGIAERCAAVLGGAGAEEIWNPLERNTFSRCPAMALALHTALARAAVSAEDIDAMDLYSCFPSPVEFALESLGVPSDRPVSLTGGLAFAGGPGNAYVLHSLGMALHDIRRQPQHRLLVTGIGMANTKHTATVLTGAEYVPATASGEMSYREPRDDSPCTVVAQATGSAQVVTWTVEYGRDGTPVNVIVILDLNDGGRTIANMRDVSAGTTQMLERDPIGRSGRVRYDDERQLNFFEFD